MSGTNNDGGPAFPQPNIAGPHGLEFPYDGHGRGGLSLRAWLAGQAITGAANNETAAWRLDPADKTRAQTIAEEALMYADALIAALNEGSRR